MNIAVVNPAAGGLIPVSRPRLAGGDCGVRAMIVVSFLFASVGFKTAAGIWHQFFTDLSMRHRNSLTGNASERTNRERLAVWALLAQTFVCEGLLLFSWCYYTGLIPLNSPYFFRNSMVLAGLCAVLYVFQWSACAAVGYAFAVQPIAGMRSFLGAFSSTQSVLGPLLLLPALGALFYPGMAMAFIYCGIGLFVLMRIFFHIKAFRIFYSGPLSLFYFFLYLCTLEILPLIALMTVISISLQHFLV